MNEFIKNLNEMIDDCEIKIAKCNNQITNDSKKTIVVKKIKNYYRYYLNNGTGRLKYLKREQIAIARETEQNDYLRKNLKLINRRLLCLKKVEKVLSETELEPVYENLPEGKKLLVFPVETTEKEFIKNWLHEHPSNQKMIESTLFCKSGHQVRSKSEMIIDDALHDNNFIFAYEAPLYLPGGRVWYPDFQILDVKNRKTIIWEHFGILNSFEYLSSVLYKYNAYSLNGYEPGASFIWTCEENNTLDTRDVKNNITWLKKGGSWGEHRIDYYEESC